MTELEKKVRVDGHHLLASSSTQYAEGEGRTDQVEDEDWQIPSTFLNSQSWTSSWVMEPTTAPMSWAKKTVRGGRCM